MAELRVGVSGWTYPPWRGNFYPEGLTQKRELAYASRRFNALEINGTFYSLQRASSFENWYQETPPGFLFTMKGGRYVTHLRRLKEPRQGLANYFASGMLALREKLGPILWQFPPNMKFDEDRFAEFFDLLPRDTEALAKLGGEHDAALKGDAYLEVDENRPVRHAVEFRHESFLTERFIKLLRKHNISLVVADVAGKFPTAEDITADWVYVRLHGSRVLYSSGYSPKEIRTWAEKIRTWHQGGEPADARRIGKPAKARKTGRDAFVFFDNTDKKQRAPVDARKMAKELGIADGKTPKQVLKELDAEPKQTKKA